MSVRVAIVGLGWAGRELWLPLLREHADFEVVAVTDTEPAARAAFDRALGIPVYPTVDALTARSVDLAVVAVPNFLHAEVAAALLGKGISVFLEKPVCLTSDEADTLAAAERSGGAMLLAGSAAPYRSDVGALAALVPDLGHIRHVDLSWVRARGIPKAGGWFTQRSKAGGGVLFDLGWHLLDTLASLLGPARFTQVVGVTANDFVNMGSWSAAWRHDQPAADADGDVEDTARGFFVREDGVSVSLHASWASHEALDVSTIQVVGSGGTAELSCTFGFSPNRRPQSTLLLTREGTTTSIPVPDEPIGNEYRRQLDGLAGILTDPGNRGRSIGEARTTVRVIEDFYASARSVRARNVVPA
ncbi:MULTISPECIES: Gfo/Idh/MocA family protein [unclassified Streptomyces]|uniref:Gfo/Idh/MocA family protein n=1 Tax=unclassified Streptomyces TaxID=2593676 RepID=UPI0022591A42|nr:MULTISPECIES: Gfo/Idh/MocA family oxidoreductase [unclassified Streptomyces]MCX5011251.1 Gfo/Idh/MocA family oxidoreductase [Streptomyces sp. NBC_00555]MCX5611740.1 Gfo/Idh/MocA family oxidoreductase [Streptomyces sp. NBC_00047]